MSRLAIVMRTEKRMICRSNMSFVVKYCHPIVAFFFLTSIKSCKSVSHRGEVGLVQERFIHSREISLRVHRSGDSRRRHHPLLWHGERGVFLVKRDPIIPCLHRRSWVDPVRRSFQRKRGIRSGRCSSRRRRGRQNLPQALGRESASTAWREAPNGPNAVPVAEPRRAQDTAAFFRAVVHDDTGVWTG